MQASLTYLYNSGEQKDQHSTRRRQAMAQDERRKEIPRGLDGL